MTGTFEALLSVDALSVFVGRERFHAVNGVSLTLEPGERLALLGPSGCGKTTTLRAIAGFERVAAGRVTLQGRLLGDPTHHVPAHQRGVGLVFQDFALFPHLSVLENVAFGLRSQPRGERRRTALDVLDLVGLGELGHRMPEALSGGQQQRVALARALAPRPQLLLLDEPFSSLDAGLRVSTRLHTERVLDSVGAAAILVTHDQAEAMAFAARILVMRAGKVEQEGSPAELYRAPRTAFVATALGPASFVEGVAEGSSARTPLGELRLQAASLGRVQLCLRPEDLTLTSSGGVRAQVLHREYRGATCLYRLRGDGFECQALAPGDAPWSEGEAVSLTVTAPVAAMTPEVAGSSSTGKVQLEPS